MDNILLTQRKYFDGKLEELSQIEDHEEKYRRSVDLVFDEDRAEFAYRSGLTRGKIIGLGLEEFGPDIVDGMNQTGQRASPSDINRYDSAKHFQTIIRARSDAMLRFGLDYIDRWVMYNNLFNQKE